MAKQSRMMNRQMRDGRDALKKTLTLQFRPKLIVRGGGLDGESVLFWITNTGGSKAYLTRLSLNFFIQDAQTSITPESSLKGDQITKEVVFMGGETKLHSVHLDQSTNEAIREQIDTDSAIPGASFTRRIRCAGTIHYKDDLDILRMTIVMRNFVPSRGRFERSENSDHDYAD